MVGSVLWVLMKVHKLANEVADMELDKVADEVFYNVVDMEVDKTANEGDQSRWPTYIETGWGGDKSVSLIFDFGGFDL